MKSINRIKATNDFALAIKKGKSFGNSSFVIHVLKNDYGYCRVGISVSAKLCNAVKWNRIKRQIRAMCDELINYNDEALDVVIIARKTYLEKSFDDNKENLKNLLNRQEIKWKNIQK